MSPHLLAIILAVPVSSQAALQLFIIGNKSKPLYSLLHLIYQFFETEFKITFCGPDKTVVIIISDKYQQKD